MYTSYNRPKANLESIATDAIDETTRFIASHPTIFTPPLDIDLLDEMSQHQYDPVFAEAKRLRSKLNKIGNQLCINGGSIPTLMYKIGELIRHLDVIVWNSSYFMENTTLHTEEIHHTHQVSEGTSMKVSSVLAMETKHRKASISDKPTDQFIHENIPINALRITKAYHILHVIFSLEGAIMEDKHLGWVMLNLLMQELCEGMDSGHALGRIWDGNEMDAKARLTAQKEGIADEDKHSLTIISCTSDTPCFTADQLQLGTSPAAIRKRIRQIIQKICEWTVNGFNADNQDMGSPVYGGRKNLIPLQSIFNKK